MIDTFQIGIVQMQGTNGDVNGNRERMKRIVETTKASYPGIRMILFAELAVTGYFLEHHVKHLAEPADGASAEWMAEVAKANDVYIAYGYVETDELGQCFNSLRFIDRSGKPLANYRKIHLTELERGLFSPGDDIVLVDTEFGKIGFLICWDLAFPELARTLAIRGADLLLVPVAWELPYDEPFQRFAQARAIDNTVYLAACNQIGTSGDLSFFGKSGLYGPDGSTIAATQSADEAVIVTEIDLSHRNHLQNCFFTMMKERRKDLYGLKMEGE
jgi:5-aminopentanamidase